MNLIVDASVAVKWFLAEPDSDAAEALLVHADTFIAPDILEAEVVNAICKRVRRGQVPPEQARTALAELRLFVREMVGARSLHEPALELALAHGHPIHDCIYLALALQSPGGELVTADRRLVAVATAAGARVRTLGD